MDKTTNFWSESNAAGDQLGDEGNPLAEGPSRGERPASESDAKQGRESAGPTPENPVPAASQPFGKNAGSQKRLNQRLSAILHLSWRHYDAGGLGFPSWSVRARASASNAVFFSPGFR